MNKRGVHLTGDHTSSCIHGLWSVCKHASARPHSGEVRRWQWERRARTETRTSKAQAGFQAGGLSQKLSCWRWMGDAISFPGWAEVSQLAEHKPMNRANTFSASSSAHQESLTATPPSCSGSTFPSVSLKNYNWHWKHEVPASLCSSRRGKSYQTLLLNPGCSACNSMSFCG